MDIESHIETAKHHTKKYAKIAREHIPEIITAASVVTAIVFYKKYDTLRGQVALLNAAYKDQQVLTIGQDLLKDMLDNQTLAYFDRPDVDFEFVARAFYKN